MEFNLVQAVAVYAIPVIFAITLHEAAHGYVARHFGDLTAWRLGRVSLNPLRHIDLIGTIVVPLAILAVAKMLGGASFLFGWAKPLPVNFHALRRPKRDMLWVAAAGPGANLVMALGWALLLKLALVMPQNYFTVPLGLIAEAGIGVNIVLMLLNLLPILPLDGGRIAVSLLPERLAMLYARSEPLGFPILLVLLFTNVLSAVLAPMVYASIGLIGTLFQL
ncbi:MAG: peptidase M50 [Betaproteobacteria bacterium RIFCSPLOWO2_02_FULL_65_24]|nr:MAG: peptidase M50 [Betaproteobacteria bacterium RIFCSPLOWO2_02_FULL_65_24]OGA35944.1 MAG: peptidase M50 [Betaproteobacteria bacterium RIFCSPLOWO2_12_FULL_62_13b]